MHIKGVELEGEGGVDERLKRLKAVIEGVREEMKGVGVKNERKGWWDEECERSREEMREYIGNGEEGRWRVQLEA